METTSQEQVTLQGNPIHPEQLKDLLNRFTHHKPFGDLPHRYTVVREALGGVARLLVTMTPKGREQSLALTHLEEAMFWANAAIARNMKEPATDKDVPAAELAPAK